MLGVLAPQAERGVVARETAVAAARDAAAAEVIARSADAGNPVARPFVSEAQELLGIAAVRRARAKRLRSDAVQAASLGEEMLARFGADAAREEDAEADRLEASVVRAVRASHDASTFGYVTPEEQKLLSRKGAFESLTIAQRERAMSSMLDRLYSEAGNYGRDDDESDEVPGVAIDRLRMASEVFGPNLSLVFGAGASGGLFERMKASRETLEKRLAKKKEALVKAEGKLTALEDAGKKGLRVKLLRAHVNRIEKSIEKIQQKLEKLKAAETKMVKDQADATKIQTAEAAVVDQARTAIGPETEDMSDQELEEMLSDIEAMRLEDESMDTDLMAASEVFGFTPIRRRALGRRIQRMRLLEDAARNRRATPVVVAPVEAGPRRFDRHVPHHASHFYRRRRRRMAHLYKWLPAPPMPAPSPYFYPGCAAGWYASDLDLPERNVLASFFRKRAAVYGSENLTPDDVEAFGAGFWEGLSTWWSNLWAPSAERKAERQEKRELRADVREARQTARAPLTPAVIEARKVWSERRGERREAGEAAAKAVRRGVTPAPTRVVMKRGEEVERSEFIEFTDKNDPRWTYRIYPDENGVYSRIWIQTAPEGRRSGFFVQKGAEAWVAINRQLNEPGTVTVGAVAASYGLEVPSGVEEWALSNPSRAYALGVAIKDAENEAQIRSQFPVTYYPEESKIIEWVIANPFKARMLFLRLYPSVAKRLAESSLTMGADARLAHTRPHLALGEGARMLAQKLDRVLATEGIQSAIARGLGDQLFDATEAEDDDLLSEEDEDLDGLEDLEEDLS